MSRVSDALGQLGETICDIVMTERGNTVSYPGGSNAGWDLECRNGGPSSDRVQVKIVSEGNQVRLSHRNKSSHDPVHPSEFDKLFCSDGMSHWLIPARSIPLRSNGYCKGNINPYRLEYAKFRVVSKIFLGCNLREFRKNLAERFRPTTHHHKPKTLFD